jgi:DNA-binding transcriptional regulator YhcF (GntR family)
VFVELNFKSGKPAYLQIVEQVKYAAASGGILPGEPLPSIRALAQRLRLNRNTVAKAYTELEHQGIIKTAPGKGALLSGDIAPYGEHVRDAILHESIDAAIVQAHHFQITREEFMKLVSQRMDHFDKQRETGDKS